MSSFEDLPSDIAINILSRLPVKTLITFRCVCKSWHSIISNPNFISMHLNRSTSHNSNSTNGYLLYKPPIDSDSKSFTLFCDKACVELSKLELPLFDCDFSSLTIVGSVNGLLCLADPYIGRTMYLCNPSIRKYKAIGCCCSAHQSADLNAYVVLGFGYHHQANDYKVVRITYVGEEYVSDDDSDDDSVDLLEFFRGIYREVEVYTLSTDSWKKIGADFLWGVNPQPSPAFANGSLHWIAAHQDRAHNELILSFDIGKEVFQEIMLPNYHLDEVEFDVSTCVLEESLSLFVYCSFKHLEGSECCYLWVMREYGVAESWTKQYTIVLEGRVERTLGFTKFDELILEESNGEIFLFDIQNHKVKYLGIRGRLDMLDVVTFTESLVLFEAGNDVVRQERSSFKGITDKGILTACNEEKCCLQLHDKCFKSKKSEDSEEKVNVDNL
uniref:F-box domain-containing protein n=1 Tax=Davidia involucrata TaxID=16924 RepID=A0A5B7B4A5_DAVIN